MMRGGSVVMQLMMLAILPMALLFIGLTLFYAQQRNTLLDEQFEARVHDLSRGLAARATQSMLAGDQEALDALAIEMLSESNIYGLRLADPMGDPMVKRGRGPKSALPGSLRFVFVPLCIPVPGQDAHQRIGEAWIWFDERPVHAIKRQGFWAAMALASLLAVLVAAVAWRLASRILRPMRESLMAMDRIGHGISGVRVEEDADNELRQLQRGVNLLADALAEQDRLRERAQGLEFARAHAEQAKAIRTLFLAHMSHEIRTPLNALVGFMHLFRREFDDESMSLRGRQYLEAMNQSSRHLGELVNDILDFSRIESGKLSLCSTPFSVIRLMDEVAVELAERARAKGLFIDVVNFLDLPAQVKSDPLRLRQVLTNLLSNAIKFCPQGGMVMRAMLEQPPDDQGRGCVLRFEVEDSGPGIPAAARARLLEPFEQLESGRQRAHQGTGLGLAISRGLVELAGGRLSIGDASLGGAMLSLTWPVDWAESAPEQGTLPVHVSVVDDRLTFRQAAYAKLSRLGWRVHVTAGGLDAGGCGDILARLPAQRDVLALRDPVERGEAGRAALLEMVSACREHASHVLVCTARDEPAWEQRIESLGATVMRCPATQRDLERTVEALGDLPFLDSRERQDALGAGASFEGRSILVVDDHPLNREVLGLMLEQAGARVLQADGGRAAIGQVEREAVDAVLLDLHMPGMDGESVLLLLRERYPELPVFMLTADVLHETAVRLQAAGARAVLHKPVAESVLFEALAVAFGQDAPGVQGAGAASALVQRFWDDEWPSFEMGLLRACGRGDRESLCDVLHTLVGTAGVVGLAELAAAARALEDHCAADGVPVPEHPLWRDFWQHARPALGTKGG